MHRGANAIVNGEQRIQRNCHQVGNVFSGDILFVGNLYTHGTLTTVSWETMRHKPSAARLYCRVSLLSPRIQEPGSVILYLYLVT